MHDHQLTNSKNVAIGRTQCILAIVILPTTILVLLGYIAYAFVGDELFLGHAGDNTASFVGENETSVSSADQDSSNEIEGLVNATTEMKIETHAETTTTTIEPTNVISTAYTAFERVPHDTKSFTQGLSYGDDGFTYETTGLYGRSKLHKIDPNTFEVIKSIDIDRNFFGEGSTYYKDANGNGRLIFITWKEQTAFVYDPTTLARLQTLRYTTTPPWNQGWGITFDDGNSEFIMSDGTSTLFFMDRDTLQIQRKIVVTRFDGSEQDELNELEMIDGLICCNIWYKDEIICVDKRNGKSVREYDLSALYPKSERGYNNVMNGIAFGEDHVLITGKRWDRMYKIRFDDWNGIFARK